MWIELTYYLKGILKSGTAEELAEDEQVRKVYLGQHFKLQKVIEFNLITILNIETSTTTCSASISINGELIDEKIILSDKYVHGEQLHILIQSLLKKNDISFTNLDGVCIASGPGSFTGLRIGVSTAKGIAFAINKPLISVDTIQVMMENYDISNKESNSIYFPMIDARRDEVYTAGYNAKKEIVYPLDAKIIDQSFLDSLSQFEYIYFIGRGQKNLWVKH